ncbi:MAG: DUF2059 domain-containing protein [Candidatus Rokubacteria bacterium]|nr:DUF2059 domain-containing protein [Candidatus Rokubacteria bacterium]
MTTSHRAKLTLVGVSLLLAIGGTVAEAQYKWVDEKGVTHYSQFPPPPAATEPAPPPASAAPPPPPSPQRLAPSYERGIRELLRLFLGPGFFDVLVDQMTRVAVPAVKIAIENDLKRPLTSAEDQKLLNALRRSFVAVFPRSIWEDEFVTLYAKHFSEGEIGELLQFYRTPVGAKAARLTALMAGEGAQIGERLAKAKQLEFAHRFREEVTREFAR